MFSKKFELHHIQVGEPRISERALTAIDHGIEKGNYVGPSVVPYHLHEGHQFSKYMKHAMIGHSY